MAPKTLGLVSVGIKAVLLFLIVVVISIGSYGIFGSDAYKTREKHSESPFGDIYSGRHVTEQAFIALAVLSFLVGCGTLVFPFIPPSDNKLWIIIGDIGVCTVAATLLTIGGGLLMSVATAECAIDGTFSSANDGQSFYSVDCYVMGYLRESSESRKECLARGCRKLYLTPVKTAAGAIALVIGILGFCAPCGLAMKIHKKEPENAGDVMGVGGYQQPGGVAAGSPAYQVYGAPPPQYQEQYVGAYGYATPKSPPQMSQSPQGAYPPQGIPQDAPQGGQ